MNVWIYEYYSIAQVHWILLYDRNKDSYSLPIRITECALLLKTKSLKFGIQVAFSCFSPFIQLNKAAVGFMNVSQRTESK